MRFATTIIITVILVIFLQGCSVSNDKSPEITTIANSEEYSRDLYSEISEKIHQENAEISNDLLLIPSLLTQVQEAYAVDKKGNSIVNKKGNRVCDREGISSEVSLWWIILYYIRQIFSVTNKVNIFVF